MGMGDTGMSRRVWTCVAINGRLEGRLCGLYTGAFTVS